jgi:hypothetical protein
MAVTLDINAVQADNGKKITVNDASENRLENIDSITSVSFTISKYDYDTNTYGAIGSITIDETYTSQEQMEYYIEISDGNLVISTKQDDTEQTIGAYDNEVIKDGIWKINFGTSADNAVDFLFHFDYESKLEVYNLHRDLPDHFKQDEIKYNEDVEAALLRKAFLNSLHYSAEFGQLEIIEEIDLVLRDLLDND